MQITPTLYESSHRSAWRRLHALIAARESADDLEGVAADIAAAQVPR
jgi:hypothetical protein